MASFLPSSQMSTLFVSNLHPNVSEAELFELFLSVGRVSSIRILKEVVVDHLNCYALVNFETEIEAKVALHSLNFKLIRNHPIRIKWYKIDDGKVFIVNLDKRIDEEELRTTFARFGKILNCKIAKNLSGNSIGNAFVQFETEKAANACINSFNETKLKDEIIRVEKYILGKENEKKLDAKQKNVLKLKMAIRNSIFKSADACENPGSDRVIGVMQSVDAVASTSKQPSIEAVCAQTSQEETVVTRKQQKEKLASELFSMVKLQNTFFAPAITAKLMENEISDIQLMMADKEVFKSKIIDAMLEIDFFC